MGMKKEDLRSRKKIVDAFASALERFNGDFPICKEQSRSVPLKYAISLSVKPRRPDERPEDNTFLETRLDLELHTSFSGTVFPAAFPEYDPLVEYFFNPVIGNGSQPIRVLNLHVPGIKSPDMAPPDT
jgi:hypothetical protein